MITFNEVDVTAWSPAGPEQLGTKPKQWLFAPDGTFWLFKSTTVNRDPDGMTYRKGDDWAEKVASAVAEMLGLPAARVELAVMRGMGAEHWGIISRKVLGDDEELVHGNELLAGVGIVGASPKDRGGYTLGAVRGVLNDVAPPVEDGGLTAWEWWVGYLVLDALVGNTDRHQENWAIITNGGRRLAPTFDHASSLGFLLSDNERIERLTTRDQNRSAAAFTARARAKFEGRPHPCDAAAVALSMVSSRAHARWMSSVERLSDIADLVAAIPDIRASQPARDFAAAVFAENRRRLLHHPVGSLTT